MCKHFFLPQNVTTKDNHFVLMHNKNENLSKIIYIYVELLCMESIALKSYTKIIEKIEIFWHRMYAR